MTAVKPATHRAREQLLATSREYPDAWALAAESRARRGAGLPEWPEWCYLPMAAWQEVGRGPTGEDPLAVSMRTAELAALGTWRMTQGIYRFDATLYEALVSTSLEGELPCDVLFRLPEWCVYVETPGHRFGSGEGAMNVAGAWVHLDWDASAKRPELRFLVDADGTSGTWLLPFVLHLGNWSLTEAVHRSVEEAERQRQVSRADESSIGLISDSDTALLGPMLSLVLYLCTDEVDLGDAQRRPANPEPVRTRRQGTKLIPASMPTSWNVGVRLGAAIRSAQERSEGEGGGAHASPRPHIRRAHFHSFWSGPRDGLRALSVRWLPPIAVGLDDGELPAVIWPVR